MKTLLLTISFGLALISLSAQSASNDMTTQYPSAAFAGGPTYKDPGSSIPELQSSGFGTLINWTIHIHDNGDLNFNEEFLLVSNGKYVGNETHSNFGNNLKKLIKKGSSIKRLEFGLSAAESPTYTNIKNLDTCTTKGCGTGPDSILYLNFKALKQVFPNLYAVNNDDEFEYDLSSSVKFHEMLANLGIRTTIAPYTDKDYWQSFISDLNEYKPDTVDRIYLQAYAGGAGNNPCDWDLGVPVYVGLWSQYSSPSEVKSQMSDWKTQCPKVLKGGFMWLYDDFQGGDLAATYAQAINSVFKK